MAQIKKEKIQFKFAYVKLHNDSRKKNKVERTADGVSTVPS